MRYLDTEDINKIGINWEETIGCIEEAVQVLNVNDYAQPIKPYLRYGDMANRIIAMPAYVGQNINVAGIKWIASFPKNIKKNIPRAHCTVILNNADTGEVTGIINSPLVSIVRTASVSGLMIKTYLKEYPKEELKVGIIGWGPIGQNHYKMCKSILGEKLKQVNIFDIRRIDREQLSDNLLNICDDWESVYFNSDIVITCTVSNESYIDKKPNPGTLLLNISLRDFTNDIYEYVKHTIIVDDWEEVCREKTDIERMHLEMGLEKDMVKDIKDVVCHGQMKKYSPENNIMFNPMGMAVFDIAICNYYKLKAIEKSVGEEL